MRLRCYVCDGEGRDDEGRCNECGRVTRDRRIGAERDPIAPASSITFEEQWAIYMNERAGRGVRIGQL